MRKFTQHILSGLFFAASWGAAVQAADAPIVLADARPIMVAPHFMSLASARGGMAGLTIEKVTPSVLHASGLPTQPGFLPIDRSGISMVHTNIASHSMPVQQVASAPEPAIILPQDKAVHQLFGEADDKIAEVAPKLGRTQHAWPLPAGAEQRLTSGYGNRSNPFNGHHEFHGGIDIAAAVGTPVLATADGVVSAVENGGGFGKHIAIKHRDGSESDYAHLSAQNVQVGQSVHQGQKIGAVGSTGHSTGPHLDFRIRRDGEVVNPLAFLHKPTSVPTDVASNDSVRIIR